LEEYNKIVSNSTNKYKQIREKRTQLRNGYPDEGLPEDYEKTKIEQEITLRYGEQVITHETLQRIMKGEKFEEIEKQTNVRTSIRPNASRPV